MLGFEYSYRNSDKRKLLFPWTCRACEGIGTQNLGYKQVGCARCNGTGFRFPSDAFNHWMRDWKWIWLQQVKSQFVSRCACGKVTHILWFEISNHSDCIPF